MLRLEYIVCHLFCLLSSAQIHIKSRSLNLTIQTHYTDKKIPMLKHPMTIILERTIHVVTESCWSGCPNTEVYIRSNEQADGLTRVAGPPEKVTECPCQLQPRFVQGWNFLTRTNTVRRHHDHLLQVWQHPRLTGTPLQYEGDRERALKTSYTSYTSWRVCISQFCPLHTSRQPAAEIR